MMVSTRELIRWLTSITRPVHGPLLFSATMRIVNLLLDICLFGLAGGGVAAVITGSSRLGWVLTALIVVALGKALAYYLEQFSGHYVAFKALELLRTSVFSTLWPKAPAIVTRSRSGDVLTSLTRDVDRIEVFYAHTFAPLVAAVVVPVITLVSVGFWVGWGIVIVPAIAVLISLTVVPFLGWKRALDATGRTLSVRATLAQHSADSVFGTEEIVGYGRAQQRIEELGQLENQLLASARVPRLFLAARRAANVALMLFTAIAVVWIGINAQLSVTVLCAVTLGSLRLFEAPRGLEDAVGYLDHSFASARRLWKIAHSRACVEDGAEEYRPDAAPTISWEDVDFSYQDEAGRSSAFALKQVNFVAAAGKHTVLIGRSGSGKSTVINLLARYEDPSQGRILLDGVDIRRFTLDSLRTKVVVVSQAHQLLDDTIATNLKLGAPDATDMQLWQVLEHVGIADEVKQMPDGIHTQVGQHGAQLSGGQNQRLCLARALLMNPVVLILDEFTANLNIELERFVREQLRRHYPWLTVVEITHRLEAISEADRVVLFDRGRVIGQAVPGDDENTDPVVARYLANVDLAAVEGV